jgi:hypothetical protein
MFGAEIVDPSMVLDGQSRVVELILRFSKSPEQTFDGLGRRIGRD